MKSLVKVLLAATLALSLPKEDKAQFSVSLPITRSYEYGPTRFYKHPAEMGLGLSCNITKSFGVRVKYVPDEIWDDSAMENWPLVTSKEIFLQTLSTDLYISVPYYKGSKNRFSGPLAGLSVGKGFLYGKEEVLKHPYFLGVFFQLNLGKDFETAHTSFFIRAEQKISYLYIDKYDHYSMYQTVGSNISF